MRKLSPISAAAATSELEIRLAPKDIQLVRSRSGRGKDAQSLLQNEPATASTVADWAQQRCFGRAAELMVSLSLLPVDAEVPGVAAVAALAAGVMAR